MTVQTRRAFLGGNTACGFFSYFEHIIRPSHAARLFVLKGGPGSGKSHFMNRVSERMEQAGFSVEKFHCSSDVDSLDGIRVPELELAWLDGTTPHVIDPQFPGVVDTFVNLHAFCHEERIALKKQHIMDIQAIVKHTFQQAYRYLQAAYEVYQNIAAMNERSINPGYIHEHEQHIMQSVFGHRKVSQTSGTMRKLFASAITPTGLQTFLPSLLSGIEKHFILEGEPGTGKSSMLGQIARASVAHGYYTEVYHSPLAPHQIAHVVIPELSVACVSVDKFFPHTVTEGFLINTNEARSYDEVKRNKTFLADAWESFRHLLDRAVSTLAHAKDVRDKLEDAYIQAMDFDGIDEMREAQVDALLTDI